MEYPSYWIKSEWTKSSFVMNTLHMISVIYAHILTFKNSLWEIQWENLVEIDWDFMQGISQYLSNTIERINLTSANMIQKASQE